MTKSDRTNSFVYQAAILAASGILVRLIGFFYKLPLTDLIGDDGNAVYGVAFNVYNFFLLMSGAGLPVAISRLVSEKRAVGRYDLAHRIFKVAFALAAGLGALSMVVIFAFARPIAAGMNMPEAYLGMMTLAPTVFIVSMMAVVRGYFQGMQDTTPTAVSQLIEQVFNAVFSVMMAHLLWNYALANAYDERLTFGAAGGTSGTGVGALAGFVFIAVLYNFRRVRILRRVRSARSKFREDVQPEDSGMFVIKRILLTAFPIIAGTAVFSVVNLIDVWLVMDGLAAAGLEHNDARTLFGQIQGKFNPITNIPAAVSSSLAIAVLPSITASYKLKQRREVLQKITTAFRTAVILTAPMALGLGILGPQIVSMLFPNHPDGGTLFIAGFASIIFLATTQIATGALQAVGKIYVPVIAAVCGAVVKIIVNLTLIPIPSINIYGAIIGTTACYLVTTIINCGVLSRTMKTRIRYARMMFKPVCASFIMALGCFCFYHIIHFAIPNNALAVIFAIIGGAGLYFVVMLLIGGVGESEISMLPWGGRISATLKRRGML